MYVLKSCCRSDERYCRGATYLWIVNQSITLVLQGVWHRLIKRDGSVTESSWANKECCRSVTESNHIAGSKSCFGVRFDDVAGS